MCVDYKDNKKLLNIILVVIMIFIILLDTGWYTRATSGSLAPVTVDNSTSSNNKVVILNLYNDIKTQIIKHLILYKRY